MYAAIAYRKPLTNVWTKSAQFITARVETSWTLGARGSWYVQIDSNIVTPALKTNGFSLLEL